ncbi:hypothetical protein HPB52_017900 [Rhipicephalus sanguineus]|uniref:Uncharacterized protein n=1 Tax=Rhipicephalus sanguineus TaxID=34632 RepID=A0A9D4T144_RHISA|nr:hypothetical protein HPB52_017900 [Rhipicephalus sanguineus]
MEYVNGAVAAADGGGFSQIGMKARSPEGHAARAMQIKAVVPVVTCSRLRHYRPRSA